MLVYDINNNAFHLQNNFFLVLEVWAFQCTFKLAFVGTNTIRRQDSQYKSLGRGVGGMGLGGRFKLQFRYGLLIKLTH